MAEFVLPALKGLGGGGGAAPAAPAGDSGAGAMLRSLARRRRTVSAPPGTDSTSALYDFASLLSNIGAGAGGGGTGATVPATLPSFAPPTPRDIVENIGLEKTPTGPFVEGPGPDPAPAHPVGIPGLPGLPNPRPEESLKAMFEDYMKKATGTPPLTEQQLFELKAQTQAQAEMAEAARAAGSLPVAKGAPLVEAAGRMFTPVENVPGTLGIPTRPAGTGPFGDPYSVAAPYAAAAVPDALGISLLPAGTGPFGAPYAAAAAPAAAAGGAAGGAAGAAPFGANLAALAPLLPIAIWAALVSGIGEPPEFELQRKQALAHMGGGIPTAARAVMNEAGLQDRDFLFKYGQFLGTRGDPMAPDNLQKFKDWLRFTMSSQAGDMFRLGPSGNVVEIPWEPRAGGDR